MKILKKHPHLNKFVFTKLVPAALYGFALGVPTFLGAVVLHKLGFEPKLASQVSGAIVLMYIAFCGVLNGGMRYIERKYFNVERH